MSAAEAPSTDYLQSWKTFIDSLQREILPLYLEHELTFDPGGVHGRMHICRSVLFAEYMGRSYHERLSAGVVDFYAIRVATAFHDSGRRANGVDLWERESADNCLAYVRAQTRGLEGPDYPQYVAGLIRKDGDPGTLSKFARRWLGLLRKPAAGDLSRQVVYDADVLEIMRPCCGHGGIRGFRRNRLHFAGTHDRLGLGLTASDGIREEFIQEAWRWITSTEVLKRKLKHSETYMDDLLGSMADARRSYPMLSRLLEG